MADSPARLVGGEPKPGVGRSIDPSPGTDESLEISPSCRPSAPTDTTETHEPHCHTPEIGLRRPSRSQQPLKRPPLDARTLPPRGQEIRNKSEQVEARGGETSDVYLERMPSQARRVAVPPGLPPSLCVFFFSLLLVREFCSCGGGMGEVEKVRRGEGKQPSAVPQQGREADREEELGRGERIKGEVETGERENNGGDG